MASKPLESGVLLSEAALTVREVPAAYVETRAVRATEKQRVLGLRVSNRVEPDQTLMWTDVATTADDRRDLSALVQPGMRAVTVITRSGSEHANQLIQPGDRVDVLVTTEERGLDTTIVLLQNVLVLAVGIDTGSEAGGKHAIGHGGDALTLSVTIREAQLVSLAGDRARLSVALRNPDDVRIVDGLVETNTTSLVDARLPKPVAAAAAPANNNNNEPPIPIKLESVGIGTPVPRRGAHR